MLHAEMEQRGVWVAALLRRVSAVCLVLSFGFGFAALRVILTEAVVAPVPGCSLKVAGLLATLRETCNIQPATCNQDFRI